MLLFLGKERKTDPVSCWRCHKLSLFPVAIEGEVHMLEEGQKGLGLGSEACHVGREQGEGVQAARPGPGDSAAGWTSRSPCRTSGHPRWRPDLLVLRQQGLRMLQWPRQSLHIVLLACLVVGVDEGDVFSVDDLHESLTTCTRAASCLAFEYSPRGPRSHRMELDWVRLPSWNLGSCLHIQKALSEPCSQVFLDTTASFQLWPWSASSTHLASLCSRIGK